MAWPKEVPVLTARDIHRGSADGPNGTHCLYGWRQVVFGLDSEATKVDRTIGRECENLIAVFNDDPRNSKRKIASVWNRAMARLGYVVGNPEAV